MIYAVIGDADTGAINVHPHQPRYLQQRTDNPVLTPYTTKIFIHIRAGDHTENMDFESSTLKRDNPFLATMEGGYPLHGRHGGLLGRCPGCIAACETKVVSVAGHHGPAASSMQLRSSLQSTPAAKRVREGEDRLPSQKKRVKQCDEGYRGKDEATDSDTDT